MPKRLKFVVEQRVLFMVRRQTWQARRFEIFKSARHFRIKSNRDVRFEFEWNLEASQVPKSNGPLYSNGVIGTLAVDACVLHLVQRGDAWWAAAPPINGQCTNFILLSVAL